MSAKNYTTISKWDPTCVAYTKFKANKGGQGRSGLMHNRNTRKPIDLVFPKMMSWGIDQNEDGKGNLVPDKYTLSLQFPSSDYPNPEASECLEKLLLFEKQIIADATANYKEWFPQYEDDDVQMAEAMVKGNFKSSIKYPNIKDTKKPDKTKAPSIRIKIPVWEDAWKIRLLNQYGEIIFPSTDPNITASDCVPKLSQVMACVRCMGRWNVENNWGIKWNLDFATVEASEYNSAPANPLEVEGMSFKVRGDENVKALPVKVTHTQKDVKTNADDDGIVLEESDTKTEHVNEPDVDTEPVNEPDVDTEPVNEPEVASVFKKPLVKKVGAKKVSVRK